MAVEDIITRIETEAAEEVRRILELARSEADGIAAEARKRVEAQRDKLTAAARQRADEEHNRIVTLARLEARRSVLAEKQRLIDRVFEETRKNVSGMGRDEYRFLIASFLRGTVEPGDSEVIVDTSEKRIDQAFLDGVSGEIGNCTLTMAAERRPIDGGFVLRVGRTETNCTLDTILRDARERLESAVAAKLFCDED